MNQYIPEYVLLNIGTNDNTVVKMSTGQDKENKIALFKEKYLAFMKLLKDAYKDTKIICLANMMTTFDNGLQNAILEDITLFNNEFGKCAYFVSLDNNTSGGDGHPSLEGHKNAASCLKYIISNLDNEL